MSLRDVIHRLDLLALDIETRIGSPNLWEEVFRWQWSPNADWKDETIGRRWREARERYLERAALLPTAEIFSVAFCWDDHACEVWHVLPIRVKELPSRRLSDEARLLSEVAELFGRLDDDCVLSGHNILQFDLPRLRLRMLRHGIDLPPALARKNQPTFDIMQEWPRFSGESRAFVSLAEVLDMLGMAHHKRHICGADVAQWLADGKYEDLLLYAAADVAVEFRLTCKMLGISQSSSVPEDEGPLACLALDNAAGEKQCERKQNAKRS